MESSPGSFKDGSSVPLTARAAEDASLYEGKDSLARPRRMAVVATSVASSTIAANDVSAKVDREVEDGLKILCLHEVSDCADGQSECC